MLTALADIHAAWGAHYATLAADETGHRQDANHWAYINANPPVNEWIKELDKHFTLEEIWDGLRKMKAHRAPRGG